MTEGFDLDRFVRAQAPVMAQVRSELKAGRKATHWMWFVFPQISGLGHSQWAQLYAIASLDEAKAYLAHRCLATASSNAPTWSTRSKAGRLTKSSAALTT